MGSLRRRRDQAYFSGHSEVKLGPPSVNYREPGSCGIEGAPGLPQRNRTHESYMFIWCRGPTSPCHGRRCGNTVSPGCHPHSSCENSQSTWAGCPEERVQQASQIPLKGAETVSIVWPRTWWQGVPGPLSRGWGHTLGPQQTGVHGCLCHFPADFSSLPRIFPRATLSRSIAENEFWKCCSIQPS